jgi:hypothetical protein
MEGTIWPIFAQKSLKALGIFKFFFSWKKNLLYSFYTLALDTDEYIKCFCIHLTKLFRFL